MLYRVAFSRTADRQLEALPENVRLRVSAHIEALAENPRPVGAKRLAGPRVLYRLRIGDYRVVYDIQEDVLVVLVVALGHRKDVYRRLSPSVRATGGATSTRISSARRCSSGGRANVPFWCPDRNRPPYTDVHSTTRRARVPPISGCDGTARPM